MLSPETRFTTSAGLLLSLARTVARDKCLYTWQGTEPLHGGGSRSRPRLGSRSVVLSQATSQRTQLLSAETRFTTRAGLFLSLGHTVARDKRFCTLQGTKVVALEAALGWARAL